MTLANLELDTLFCFEKEVQDCTLVWFNEILCNRDRLNQSNSHTNYHDHMISAHAIKMIKSVRSTTTLTALLASYPLIIIKNMLEVRWNICRLRQETNLEH